MRKVIDIYKEYNITTSITMHMLRVTAVASMICDAMTVPVDKDAIILAALFHDVGNLVRWTVGSLPEFYEPEGKEYWHKIVLENIEKYGNDEHEVAVAIMRELKLPEKSVYLVDQMKFSYLCRNVDLDDFNLKIIHYADCRVAPKGVLSYQGRMDEASVRYHETDGVKLAERAILVECGKEIEKQIFANCKIKPEDITDESVAPIIEKLKDFVIN